MCVSCTRMYITYYADTHFSCYSCRHHHRRRRSRPLSNDPFLLTVGVIEGKDYYSFSASSGSSNSLTPAHTCSTYPSLSLCLSISPVSLFYDRLVTHM